MNYSFRYDQQLGLLLPDEQPAYSGDLVLRENHWSTDGLLACWLFNEAGGNVIFDLSGNRKRGILTAGPQWTADKFGSVLSFDHSDDYIDFGTGPSLSGTIDFTISMWINTTLDGSTGDDGMTLIAQRDPGYNGEYVVNIGRNYDGADPHPGQVMFIVYNAGMQFEIWSDSRVDDGNWHHLLLMRVGTNGYIFIDGVMDKSGSGTLKSMVATNHTHIGYDALYDLRYYGGLMANVCIYERALLTDQIVELYKNPSVMVAKEDWALLSVIAGATYYQSLDATTVPVPSFVKQTEKPLVATTVPVSTFVKQTEKSFAVVTTPVPVFVKQTEKPLAATTVPASSVVKQTEKSFTVVTTPTPTFVKQTEKTLVASSVEAASVTKKTSKTLAAITIPVIAFVKQTEKILSVLSVPAVLLVKKISKTLSVVSVGLTSIVKKTSKTLGATSVGSAVMDGVKLVLKTLAAVTTPVAGLVKQTGKTLASSSVGLVSTVKKVSKTLTVVTIPTPLFVKKVSKTLVAVCVGSVTFVVEEVVAAVNYIRTTLVVANSKMKMVVDNIKRKLK